jgi:hypothetical protein
MVDIKFFEETVIDKAQVAFPGWSPEEANNYLQNTQEALAVFLRNWAYERAGGDPRRPQIAERVVRESQRLDPGLLWTEFKNAMENRSLDRLRNPLAHDDPSRCVENKRCVLCALRNNDGGYDNIIAKIKRHLENDEVITAHNFLISIRGIRIKIAPLFLRDMALSYRISLENKKFRVLLQPIDTWVKRIAHFLITHQYDPEPITSDLSIATWIVHYSGANSPEKANLGMWFFGSQIIGRGNADNLARALNDCATAARLLEEYVNRVRNQNQNR